MRIIAGLYRGRTILPPPGLKTRPITDRVKESLFGILAQPPPGAYVADLFAGTGSLGLEALSRGGDFCCFVERDRRALALLKQNVQAIAPDQKVLISSKNAWLFTKWYQPERPFDLIFVDPPYLDSRDSGPHSKLGKLLLDLSKPQLLAEGGIVVLRHESAYPCQAGYGCLALGQSRRYGSMALSFLVPEDSGTWPDAT